MKDFGPKLPLAEEIHKQKYRGWGETFREAINRISYTLQDGPEHYHTLRRILLHQKFLPGGRIQAAMGSTRNVTALNCYVSDTIQDSYIDDGGIMDRAKEAAATMRMGGGVGYDFSTLRPRGDLIRKLQSQSSGPVSFMSIFNQICLCTSSAGHRRGAQMAMLRVDHPDIEEYIRAKQNSNELTGFNTSIAITDEFMEAVAEGKQFPLTWGGREYKVIDARSLWEMIMRSTWDYAEPGVFFVDTVNRMNNLWYLEDIRSSNPCGEQPLPPNGACLLGSFNLAKYIKEINGSPVDKRFCGNGYYLDVDELKRDVPPVVRAMDNVIDQAVYPLEKQAQEAKNKRRMGLGVTGVANAFEALGYLYGDDGMVALFERGLSIIKETIYESSCALAKEKGPFPLFDMDRYLKGEFIKTLPDRIQEMIYKYGIRNSHLTSIAPTGTISLTADNVSSGIEPVFSPYYQRQIMDFDGARTENVEDYGYHNFGIIGRLANDCTTKHHVNMLNAASRHVDSAVSKTCNVDPNMPWEDFKQIYFDAWRGGAKGCTTFNPGGQRAGIITIDSQEAPKSCTRDPETGKIDCE